MGEVILEATAERGMDLRARIIPAFLKHQRSSSRTVILTRRRLQKPPAQQKTASSEPPRQASNLDHRAMACPRLDKVVCRLDQARHSPAFPRVDFTASPYCRCGLGDVQTIFPPARGR
jgi:hypothetical protein